MRWQFAHTISHFASSARSLDRASRPDRNRLTLATLLTAYVIEVHHKGRKAAATVGAGLPLQNIYIALRRLARLAVDARHPLQVNGAILGIPGALVFALILTSCDRIFSRHDAIIPTSRHANRHVAISSPHKGDVW
jgi:hypothetical protein